MYWLLFSNKASHNSVGEYRSHLLNFLILQVGSFKGLRWVVILVPLMFLLSVATQLGLADFQLKQ